MDSQSEHGDNSSAPDPSSEPAAEKRAEAQAPPEPAAGAASAEAADARAWQGAQRAGDDPTPEPAAALSSEPDPADTLSPAVRRLVRQYDLDITGVFGTGPAGKIRVGDIIGMLDGRAETRARASEAPSRAAIGAADAGASYAEARNSSDARTAPTETTKSSVEDFASTESARTVPTTTVFECDVSRVLSHRKRERQGDVELLLVSYFIAACLEALRAAPEIVAGPPGSPENAELAPRLGVLLATTEGSVRRGLVAAAATALDECLHAVDAQLRTSAEADLRPAHILIHCYGASGSLLATPTAIGAGHVGSIGIGRVRREIVVKTVDGQEAPRVAALCYLTFTFRPERLALEGANRFVGEWVRVLEQWPIEPASAFV